MIINAINFDTGRNTELEVIKVHRNKKLDVKFIQLVDGSILQRKRNCLYGNVFRSYTIPDYEIERVEQDAN